jgi:hypothetical protein
MSLSSEKRTEILQLLAGGKITAEEAAELLSDAPEAKAEAPAPPPAPKAPEPVRAAEVGSGQKPRWLHIHVNDLGTGKSKVKVNIPLRLAQFGFNMGKRFAPEIEELKWDDLSRVMSEDSGVIVEVQDEEDGEHVKIFVD